MTFIQHCLKFNCKDLQRCSGFGPFHFTGAGAKGHVSRESQLGQCASFHSLAWEPTVSHLWWVSSTDVMGTSSPPEDWPM